MAASHHLVAPPPILEDDPAELHFRRCLAVWVDWMHSSESARLRLSRHDSVFGSAPSNYMTASDDSDIVYEASDRNLAYKVNACVESLMPAQQLAISIDNGLARSWPFLGLSMEEQLELGMLCLRRLIARRC